MWRHSAVHGPALLHNAERRDENQSSRMSKRWESSVFVI